MPNINNLFNALFLLVTEFPTPIISPDINTQKKFLHCHYKTKILERAYMNSVLSTIKQTRLNFIALIDELSLEQVCRIPEGFNNSIVWNFGHIIATQQVLCYELSSIPFSIPDEIVKTYRKGTTPMQQMTEGDLNQLKILALTSLESLKNDYTLSNFFANFRGYQTSYGVYLSNIEEVITFMSVHEGLHLGYAMAQKHAIL